MTKIEKRVAEAFELDQEIKALTEKLNGLKDEIKEYAREHGIREIGNPLLGAALVSDREEITINPEKLFNELPKKEFFKHVKVCVGKVKEKYGKDFVKKIGNIPEVYPFSVIRLYTKD
jgi:hypothetical protein